MATGNWQGMVANITAKGMLAKRMYVVFTTPAGGMEAVMKNLEEHLAYQVDLEARGIMFGAGPFANDAETDWEGEGMVIVRAASLEEARAIHRLGLARTGRTSEQGVRDTLWRWWRICDIVRS